MAELPKVSGHACSDDDMNWTVECPKCFVEIEYEGFFDAGEINKCKCGCEFLTEKVYFEDGSFMK